MLLPLGTVLYLKDGTVKVVVINRAIVFEVDGEQQLFEYEGCRFPEGSNGDDGRFYFNNSDVEKVVYKGYEDEEEQRFQQVYADLLKEKKIKLADVDQLQKRIEEQQVSHETKAEQDLFGE